MRCESPIKQNLRHVKLLKKWLSENMREIAPSILEEALFPVVLFTRAKWIKTNDCSMPVFDSGFGLSMCIRRKTKETLLSNGQIDKIAEAIINARPHTGFPSGTITANNSQTENADLAPIKVNVQTGKTKQGRSYVKVFGNKEEAQKVWETYEKAV